MGNIDNGNSLFSQGINDLEKHLRFLAGQGCCRLIHDEQFRILRKTLQDLYQLTLTAKGIGGKKTNNVSVDGQSVGLRCGYAYINLPPQITPDGQRDTGICISADAAVSPFRTTLHLIPRNVIIGVGCRKNVDSEQFERFIMEKLNENGIPFFRVTALHTIDIKRDEPAIVAFCRKYQLPLRTFTAERLRTAEGSFESSAFVLRNTGVDNVCERSAAMGGRIIVPKISGSGMTFAAAEQDIIIDFGRDADE